MKKLLLLTLLLCSCNNYSDYKQQIEEDLKTTLRDLPADEAESAFVAACVTPELVEWADRFCDEWLLTEDKVVDKFYQCFATEFLGPQQFKLEILKCQLDYTILNLDRSAKELEQSLKNLEDATNKLEDSLLGEPI